MEGCSAAPSKTEKLAAAPEILEAPKDITEKPTDSPKKQAAKPDGSSAMSETHGATPEKTKSTPKRREATPRKPEDKTEATDVSQERPSPRVTRRTSSSASAPSPFLIEGVTRLRRTRSSVSETEPEPHKVSTPSRSSKRLAKTLPEVEDEKPVAKVEPTSPVAEKSKRKRSEVGSSPSPPRKSSRLESAKKQTASPRLVDAVPSPKSARKEIGSPKPASGFPSPKSEPRRRTRKSSSTSASPVQVSNV